MSNKCTTNVNSIHDSNDGYTVVKPNDGDNKNNSNNALKSGYQRPSSREEIDNSFITEQKLWERIFSWRSFMVVLLHMSCALNLMPAVMMPMSLVCMCGPVRGATNHTQNNSKLPPISTYTEFPPLENITAPQEKVYEFHWDSEIQGLLISGTLFTVFLSPPLGNVIRSYIGNKLTLTLFSVFVAFSSFMAPFAARTSPYLLLAIRILSGLCIYVNIPISVDTLAWWIPAKEKLTSTTIVTSGLFVGASLGSVITGYMCKTGVDNGWPLTYYLHGLLVVVWILVWYSLSSRKPENHSYISEQEKTYILARRVGMNHANTKGADRTPYQTILTSRPVLAFIATSVFHMWAFTIVFICLPLYLTSVLKFSLEDAGSVFSVLSIIRLPGVLTWSALGNWLLGRKYMTTNKARKICFCFGQGLGTVFCLGVSFLDESHKWLASVMVGVAIVSVNFGTTMASVIPLDMAPRYAGFISGISSSVSFLMAITGPLIAAAITKQGSFEEWRVVWISMTLVNFTAGLVFLIFGSASLQSWAVPETVSTTVKVHDQSSSDLKPSNDSATASLNTHKKYRRQEMILKRDTAKMAVRFTEGHENLNRDTAKMAVHGSSSRNLTPPEVDA